MRVRGFAPWLLLATGAMAQDFTSRGFFEIRNFVYLQEAPGDSGLFVSEGALRWEGGYKVRPWFRLNGSLEARTDTHRQMERIGRLDWRDYSVQRPAFSLRRISATLNKGPLTVEVGRQFIRWGKADLLNPTDRFAPRDFLNPIQTDLLGVTALRTTWEQGANTIDVVWTPIFTPSRTPLFNQRWSGLTEQVQQLGIVDNGLRLPERQQAGIRWNHIGRGYEFSTTFYEGVNHLPLIDARLRTIPDIRVDVQRHYPRLRLYGADGAVPLRWFTVKSEAGYYQDPSKQNDEFLLYVIQLERQSGEWVFVGGYAGEWVAARRLEFAFAPDRGIARTFLGRASYNLTPDSTVAVEGAVRQTGSGGYLKGEYTRAFGDHWRATTAFAFLRGQQEDFFGQYRHNSHFLLTLRYSF